MPPIGKTDHTVSADVGRQELYQLALELVDPLGLGWSVFPVGADKKALVKWSRVQRRRPSDRDLARWFDRLHADVRGLAVVLGPASDPTGRGVLACRDFDTADGYLSWSRGRPDLAAALPTVRTARGFHVYVRLRGFCGFVPLGDGDLRADPGHYAVLPPSLHPAGVRYRWLHGRPFNPADVPLLAVEDTGFLTGRPLRPEPAEARVRVDRGGGVATCHIGFSAGSPVGAGGGPGASDVLGSLPAAVREAVLRTQPTRVGHRNEKLLYLARSLLDLDPAAEPRKWFGAVRAWCALAAPVVGTKDVLTNWVEFMRAWRRARVPVSRSLPMAVMGAAAAATEGTARAKILAAARAMHASGGGRPFHLSRRTAARVAGVNGARAGVILRELIDAGELAVVTKGEPSARKRLATVYMLGPAAERTV